MNREEIDRALLEIRAKAKEALKDKDPSGPKTLVEWLSSSNLNGENQKSPWAGLND
jgi:hypothetical protein